MLEKTPEDLKYHKMTPQSINCILCTINYGLDGCKTRASDPHLVYCVVDGVHGWGTTTNLVTT